MGIIKGNNPTHFDSYGRHITREAYMNEGLNTMVNGCNCGNDTATEPVQVTPVSPMDIKSNGNCNCNCGNSNGNGNNSNSGNDNNTYSDVTNHALYLKYHNVRIKYVGFVYEGINYIVDLDNRKVLYKPYKEIKYAQLMNRITVNCNSLTSSYNLSFALYNNCHIVNVVVYPNDIDNCNIVMINNHTHEQFILDRQYISYEYFDAKNMLDEHGNIITFVNYADIFKLTKDDLGALFTYSETLDFIKDTLDSIHASKDLVEVVKKLLTSIRNKYNNWNKECDCENNANDLLNETFKEYNHCHHEHHHKPHTIKNCHSHKIHTKEEITERNIAGIYHLSTNDSVFIRLNEDFTLKTSFDKEEYSNSFWSIVYHLNENSTEYEKIIIKIVNKDKDEYYEYIYNPEKNILTNINDNSIKYIKDDIIIPNFDFDIMLNNYVKPQLIISNGKINETNKNITIEENSEMEKKVSLKISRDSLLNIGGMSFLFKRKDTILKENSVTFYNSFLDDGTDIVPNICSFDGVFDGKHDCIHYNKNSIYQMDFNESIMHKIHHEIINNIIVKFAVIVKNDDGEMNTVKYKIFIDIGKDDSDSE